MKSLKLTSLPELNDTGADMIIDVRAPSEFAEDHLPGAINLPVLSDAQRAEVGTIYTRESAFTARKIGAALVAENAAAHLKGPLADKAGDWQPLVYCWRGGQRSGSFATILDQVGWRVHLLEGGYRAYRKLIVDSLYKGVFEHRIALIEGGTGTGKTQLLQYLDEAGGQMLDLEALAAHRGSIFGGVNEAQPSQKMFETQISATLCALDPDRTTWVEAESSKIGSRLIPPALWSGMCAAPRIELRVPLAARAEFLCRAYADLTENAANLRMQLDHLRPYHAVGKIAWWQELAEDCNWQALATDLIDAHYDPRYSKSAARRESATRVIEMESLDESELRLVARDLVAEFR